MAFAIRKYEEVYDQVSIDDYLESLRDKGIGKYRCKTIVSGEMLEIEIYPLFKRPQVEKSKPLNISRRAQMNLNDKNRRKRVMRLVNTNFGHKDIWLTFTYNPENVPEDKELAYNDIKNYIRRLQRHIKKSSLEDLKYIYTTEWVKNELTGKLHAHHHVIMNFRDRDKAESLWNKAGRTQARRLQPDDYGLNGLASYIAKEETKEGNRKGSKRYGCSLNLKKPDEYIADTKIKKRDVIKLAENQNEGQDFFEDLYSSYFSKSYKFLDMTIKGSNYHAGAYIYVQMKQKPKIARKGYKNVDST